MAWYILIISSFVSLLFNKDEGQRIRNYGVLIFLPFFGIPFLMLKDGFKENNPFRSKKFWKYFIIIYITFCTIAIVMIEITKEN